METNKKQKTKLYEIRGGKLFSIPEREDMTSPDIAVFNYDQELTKQDLCCMLDLKDAEIKFSAIYPVNENGKEPYPEYYIYHINKN